MTPLILRQACLPAGRLRTSGKEPPTMPTGRQAGRSRGRGKRRPYAGGPLINHGAAEPVRESGECETTGRTEVKMVAVGLHVVGVSTLITGIGVLAASEEPLLAIIPIGSSLVGAGSLLFDFLSWRG